MHLFRETQISAAPLPQIVELSQNAITAIAIGFSVALVVIVYLLYIWYMGVFHLRSYVQGPYCFLSFNLWGRGRPTGVSRNRTVIQGVLVE
jgi:hypothetical protein